MTAPIEQRLADINERIRKAAGRSGRNPEQVRLVAVTKTVSADRIVPAIAAGIRILGENYIQEAMDKIDTLSAHPASWHFIGHLQSNKARFAVRYFDLIHSVDTEKLAAELDKQAAKLDKVQRILIQVNIGDEETKSGVSAARTLELVRAVSRFKHLAVEGLMTMPPFFDAPEQARPFFRALCEIRNRIAGEEIPGVSLRELSMGMTGDFETAIEEGATLVRIGTALFGERQ